MEPKTEITLNLLRCGSLFPNVSSVVVDSIEDGIKKAKEIHQTQPIYGFFFSEREYLEYNQKRYYCAQEHKKPIVYHLITASVLTHDDVVALGDAILTFNMEVNNYKYIIRTVLNNYQPYISKEETILLDKDFNPIQL